MNTSVNHREPATVLYSSAFSELTYQPDKSLIVATWKENSKKLLESGVKDEINRLLDHILIRHARQVVVDARCYVFTNNIRIQQWINAYYVPRLMESNVEKYGFVVDRVDPGTRQDFDPDVRPHVKYFASLEDALGWMD